MTDPLPISSWKRIAIRSFFGGVGLAITLGLITGGAIWYDGRPTPPKPWNSKALTAAYDTTDFTINSTKGADCYPVRFYYKVQNNTNANYAINASSFTPMAVLAGGNVLSKQFGLYQKGDAIVDGPAFIPPGGTARITIEISYFYPSEFTDADKNDAKKIVSMSLGRRMDELNGFVLFDELNHYRVDLPKGWKEHVAARDETAGSDKKP
jgi:hypothetical protein